MIAPNPYRHTPPNKPAPDEAPTADVPTLPTLDPAPVFTPPAPCEFRERCDRAPLTHRIEAPVAHRIESRSGNGPLAAIGTLLFVFGVAVLACVGIVALVTGAFSR